VNAAGIGFLGPRVPSLIISPWVDAGVFNTRLEHTSIVKTVLLRKFGADHPRMGRRVHQSDNLGLALTRETPRPAEEMPPVDESPPMPPGAEDIGRKPHFDEFHDAIRLLGGYLRVDLIIDKRLYALMRCCCWGRYWCDGSSFAI
jgi:hypothetical protein